MNLEQVTRGKRRSQRGDRPVSAGPCLGRFDPKPGYSPASYLIAPGRTSFLHTGRTCRHHHARYCIANGEFRPPSRRFLTPAALWIRPRFTPRRCAALTPARVRSAQRCRSRRSW